MDWARDKGFSRTSGGEWRIAKAKEGESKRTSERDKSVYHADAIQKERKRARSISDVKRGTVQALEGVVREMRLLAFVGDATDADIFELVGASLRHLCDEMDGVNSEKLDAERGFAEGWNYPGPIAPHSGKANPTPETGLEYVNRKAAEADAPEESANGKAEASELRNTSDDASEFVKSINPTSDEMIAAIASGLRSLDYTGEIDPEFLTFPFSSALALHARTTGDAALLDDAGDGRLLAWFHCGMKDGRHDVTRACGIDCDCCPVMARHTDGDDDDGDDEPYYPMPVKRAPLARALAAELVALGGPRQLLAAGRDLLATGEAYCAR